MHSGYMFEEAANGLRPALRVFQVVQTKFQKRLARLGFPPRVLQQLFQIWKTQRDTDAWEGPGLRHQGVSSISRALLNSFWETAPVSVAAW